jgi:putative ABC transport system permease protein
LVLSILGVAIGVAAVCSIHRANASVGDSFRDAVDAVSGRARLSISGLDGLPDSFGAKLRWIWDVGSFAPSIDRFAVVADGTDEPVEVFGVDATSEAGVRQYRLVEPKDPEGLKKLFDVDAALAPDAFVRRHRLSVGNRIPLFANGRQRELVLAGILEFSGPARASGGQVLITGLATAQKLFDMPGRVDRLDVAFPESIRLPEIQARIERVLPAGARVERPQARGEAADKMVRAFRFNLSALGAIALLVGIFLIYNTLSISVLRRRPEIGTFRALGASRGMIFRAFLSEGLLFGAAGTLLGEAFGVLFSRAALSAVGTTVVNIYRPTAAIALSGSLEPFVTSAIAGMAASVIASLAPALEAARVSPAVTQRAGSVEGKRRRQLPRLSIAAAAFALAGFLLALLPPVGGFPLFGFGAVGCTVASLALISPATIVATERLLRSSVTRTFGSPGRLAGAFFSGNVSRNSVAIAALSLALGMTAAMAVLIASLRSTVKTWVEQSVASDLFLKSATGARRGIVGLIPGEAIDFLRAIPGVASVDSFRAIDATASDATPFTIGSGDFAAAAKAGSLPFFSARDPIEVVAEARSRGLVLVSEPFARRFHRWRGDRVEIPTPEGVRLCEVGDVYSDFSNDRGTVVLDRRLFLSLFHDSAVSTIAVNARPGISPEELRDRILKASAGRFAFSILTNRTLRREVLRIFDSTFAVTYGLEAIALLVAVLGVVNALFSLILERRRELALLRVLGASRRQLRRSITIEAGLIGASSLFLAALSGAAFAALLILVINRQSFGWTVRTHIPALQMAGAFGLAAAATLLASLGPARLGSGLDLAQAMREE